MSSLLEQQRAFAAALMASGPATSHGLAVYRGNVFGNWAKTLAAAYPIVRKIVGEDFFEGLAGAYGRAHPSTSGDLNEYGAQLADFVAAFPHTRDLPYLPDVARMEWLAHRVYYAAEVAPFDPASLPNKQYEDLRPVLAPACALMESSWPLARIWEIHQYDHQGEFEVDLEAGPEGILVHRPRWRARVRALDPGDYRFLRGARDGEGLGDALEAALGADSQFDPAGALARWVEPGVIAELR